MQAAAAHRLHSISAIISVIFRKMQYLTVAEVPDSGNRHGHPKSICSFDYLGVADRAAGLNDGCGAGFGNGFQTVGEWEIGIRGGDRALQGKNRLHGAEFSRVDPARLAGTDPDGLAMSMAEAGVDDRV